MICFLLTVSVDMLFDKRLICFLSGYFTKFITIHDTKTNSCHILRALYFEWCFLFLFLFCFVLFFCLFVFCSICFCFLCFFVFIFVFVCVCGCRGVLGWGGGEYVCGGVGVCMSVCVGVCVIFLILFVRIGV